MKTLKLIVLGLIIIFPLFIQAQRPHPPQGDPEGVISGTVITSEKNPVEYANVVIYSLRDSSMITGGITDEVGNFKLQKVPYGKFYMCVKFIGFEKKRITGIMVTPKKQDVKIGTITLENNSQQIEEVVVEGEKRHIEYKIDKKVINVNQDLTSTGETAVEILENTPSVETDIDGNVTLRGSSSFTVLIDGKPTVLEGSDALQQIPASEIEKIEIITNPSAKYDPDGVAGIINIITKQKKQKGFNGIFNASIDSQLSHSSDILLNYRNGKFNVFAGFDYNERNHPGIGYTDQQTYYDTTTFYQIVNSEHIWEHGGYKAKAGFDYYLNDNNTFTFSGSYGERKFGMEMNSENHEYLDPGTFDEYFLRNTIFNINGYYYSFDLNYEHKFNGDNNHKISALAYYSLFDGDEINSLFQDTTNSNWEIMNENNYKQQSFETKYRQQYRAQIDYERPIGEKSKFETGYAGRYHSSKTDYKLEVLDNESGNWLEDKTQTNYLTHVNNIQAVYAMFSSSIKGFDYQLGLRTEYTSRLMEQEINNESYPYIKFDFFPTVHLSKEFGTNQMQASYSRRIKRPRGWYLNPFPFVVDSHTIRAGNPTLAPEYIDSYELNYLKRIKMMFFSVEAYYRQTNNKINRVQYLQDDNIMLHTFDNIDRDRSIGVEGMINMSLGKVFNFNISSNFYHYIIEGDIIETNVKSTNTWNMRGNLTLKFKTDTRIQLMGFYMGPSITSQGNRDGFFMTSAAIRQDLFKNKLSLTFKVADIFSTMNYSYTSETEDFYLYNERNRMSPVFSFSLTYRINNYKTKKTDRTGQDVDYEGEGSY